MRRATHPDVTELETTNGADHPRGADHHIGAAGPSYVESVLFARRPMRRSIPGSSPGTASGTKAGTAKEQERN